MKSIQLFFFLICLPWVLCSQTKKTISIQNTMSSDRKEAIVSIKWETILSNFKQIDSSNFVVINTVSKQQIPFQLEYLGQKTIQNLLVQVTVKSNSVLQLSIQKGKPLDFITKSYARFVPERKDDFAWENDRIAFRVYGKAIEKTNEDAYGLDVWVKRTDKMILNERYKVGDYHIDHGNGLDYYHVGFSLGAGNMAPYIKDTVRYSDNYHQWKVLDNGPLRSSFVLAFDEWDADGIKVKAIKTITLDAGSQLSHIENVYTYQDDKPLPVVIGIIKRPEAGILSLNEQEGIIGYWEPRHGEDGTTGVGVIINRPVSNSTVGTEQVLTKMQVKNNEITGYYAGAAWDRAGKFTNAVEWFNYLNIFSQELKNPLLVSIK